MTTDHAPDIDLGFSTPKQETLRLLKESPDLSLAAVARGLGISKVAALRHLAALEGRGLVERSYAAEGVGRPRAHFRLSPRSSRLFPEAYTHMSLCALAYIEDRLGHDAVVEMLQQRAHEVEVAGGPRLAAGELRARVEALARLRTEGGYMAEVGPERRRSVEMLEHNCPILAIAARYPEACEVERSLFERLLRARVDVAHRVVAGDPVCRFVVRPGGARK